ncbi:hypothetical protein [Nostoc sphaeroides]|uniref:Uncharacterized protein n=1 Tax=Nostoc sphaeroides CCNUC1 TaxID=2653204 RepID=A0A5P8WJ43_9NOSO|nr:hypothetical protein [Nostoc sphaeroides]QFS52462.1 hypothetical protein GXM_09956 [Nostoc sphaeroides CCNUC1]
MTDCQTVWLGFVGQRRSPRRETLRDGALHPPEAISQKGDATRSHIR